MKPSTRSSNRILHSLKLAFTAFMAVLIPVYWYQYGSTNFLYFCDTALQLTLAGESLLPQTLWCLDFAVQRCGHPMTGMTAYMFDGSKPLSLPDLSLLHGWMPFLLAFLVYRLGYDKRALKGWTALASGFYLVAYFWLPKAGASLSDPNLPRNVNYVFRMNDAQPQTWIRTELYLVTWLALLFILAFVPTHLALKKICPTPEQAAAKRV